MMLRNTTRWSTGRSGWLAIAFAAALALVLSGCADESSESDPEAPGTEKPADETPAGEEEGGEQIGQVESPLELGRSARRMTIEQLSRSIEVLTGGIIWAEDFGTGPLDLFDALAEMLGVPDYNLVTEENLEPNLIVTKFLGDAANRVCLDWVGAEMERSPDERTLIRHGDPLSLEPEDVDETLRWAHVRFFGRTVDSEDDAALDDLRALFDAASGAAAPGQEAHDGWLGVCIAMMTDPGFILY